MRENFLDASWHRIGPLKPKLRSHVRVHRHRYHDSAWYVVEDTASGRTHRFTPAVYLFVGLMNGQRTVDEIWQQAVSQLKDDAPTQGEVVSLLAQLNSADLLQTDIAPNAQEMLARYDRYAKAKRRGSFGNPLAMRLPVWDPDRFLEATLPVVRHAFTGVGAALWLATVLVALILIGIHWSELSEGMSDRILAAESLLLTAMVFPVLKFFHELGHAYATKIGGGEVHELGLMVLVFAPVPYVDASASIAFRRKWRRVLVGAAGMLTELFVAAIAMVLWTLVEPGLVRSLLYQTVLIAGVSTVLFNINPLLRFDGYYILSDIIEIPNLGARSTQYWTWLVNRYGFGLHDSPPSATARERSWFVTYAPLALAYRILMLFSISLFVAAHYFVIGALIAGWGLLIGLGLPVYKSVKYLLTAPRLEKRRFRAIAISLAGVGVFVGAIFLVPVPLYSVSEGVVWLPEESYVRAADNGFVSKVLASSGADVHPGDVLVEADEPELDARIKVLQSEIGGLRRRLASEQFTDRNQAEITRQEIALKQTNLGRAAERRDALTVRSSVTGTFLSPASQDLPGRYVRRGDVLGYVVFPQSRIARIVVPQDDIDLVRNRLAKMDVRLTNQPSISYQSKIVREVPAASDRLPSRALTEAGGGHFAADPRDSNQLKTLARTFQFDLELPAGAARANFGSHVLVRFDHGFEPLAAQWYRRMRQLFLSRFEA
ncbi:HlyD family efflux transporter periplasmic adaptor subunit [Bradyrhizobium japonicum]|uniref:HlyD family efflux transporter periplasmic adaptor subunit n=1 Tax=Bradyrhizobium japonicum TaxID=375 RepID=UPI001BA552CA|nr:HlyD family efflux transporter periplasmic adaptor subunit [Bradyrhizobium japonicum]MBR0993105.1 HlyD family efflux transporter periplasmic adaptor subunit [Bradyrhizobium japonicum]